VHDWRDVAVLEQNIERVWIGECGARQPLASSILSLLMADICRAHSSPDPGRTPRICDARAPFLSTTVLLQGHGLLHQSAKRR
jgi:hypothetical protein